MEFLSFMVFHERVYFGDLREKKFAKHCSQTEELWPLKQFHIRKKYIVLRRENKKKISKGSLGILSHMVFLKGYTMETSLQKKFPKKLWHKKELRPLKEGYIYRNIYKVGDKRKKIPPKFTGDFYSI